MSRLALLQVDTQNYGWILRYYDSIQELLAAEPEALFGLSYTFVDTDGSEIVGTRVRLPNFSNVNSCRELRRQRRRVERLGDRLRFLRHNCGLEIQAAIPGSKRRIRFERRFADLSSRLALVDCVGIILGGGLLDNYAGRS